MGESESPETQSGKIGRSVPWQPMPMEEASNSPPPPTIAGMERRDQLRMLGVTITNDFTVTALVTELTTKCAQTQYALRVLCAHELNDEALQIVFRSVVVAKLLNTARTWHGLTRASDWRWINALFHRAHCQGYCLPDLPTFEELCDSADDEIFSKAVRLTNQILHDLLPPPSTASQHYELRYALVHYSCLNIPHTCQIATSLRACYTKTLISYLDHFILFYMLHSVTFCLLPAFWHAICNRRIFIHSFLVMAIAISSTCCTYTWRDDQTELTWVAGYMLR